MVWFDSLNKTSKILLTLGVVWTVMGLGYENSGLQTIGFIFLLSGLIALTKKSRS